MSKEQIVALNNAQLWAIVKSTNPLTERFCNELTWAKAELTRRGFVLAGERRELIFKAVLE